MPELHGRDPETSSLRCNQTSGPIEQRPRPDMSEGIKLVDATVLSATRWTMHASEWGRAGGGTGGCEQYPSWVGYPFFNGRCRWLALPSSSCWADVGYTPAGRAQRQIACTGCWWACLGAPHRPQAAMAPGSVRRHNCELVSMQPLVSTHHAPHPQCRGMVSASCGI